METLTLVIVLSQCNIRTIQAVLMNRFTAYDCTHPTNIVDYGYSENMPCDDKQMRVTSTVNKTYQLVQREQYHRLTGYKCKVLEKREVRYCGNADHSTSLGVADYENLIKVITPLECQKWHQERVYHDPKGRTHLLFMDFPNKVSYYAVGKEYGNGYQVSCEGGEWEWNDNKLYSMIVRMTLTIEIEKENYKYDSDQLVAQTEDKILPCSPNLGACTSGSGTYLWKYKETSCNAGLIKEGHTLHGIETTGDEEDKVFMSTDGNLIRLVLKETVSLCGRILWSTNHPGIYLYPAGGNRPFTEAIHPSEIRIETFVKINDESVYHSLKDAITNEFHNVLRADCRRKVQESRKHYWMQFRDPGLVTWLIKDGVFATTAGEVIYRYNCEKVAVRAREESKCYNALPVLVIDWKHPHAQPELYLEPLTRRLTKHAEEIPCSTVYMTKYQNEKHQWVMSTPAILEAKDPNQDGDVDDLNRTPFELQDINFAESGIYTENEFLSMRRYQEFSRTKNAINAALAIQGGYQYRPGTVLGAEQLFPDMIETNLWSGVKSKFTSFLQRFGQGSSILISLWMIGRAVSTIALWVYSFIVLKETHGCTKLLWWVPCSEAYLMKLYRDAQRRGEDVTHRRYDTVTGEIIEDKPDDSKPPSPITEDIKEPPTPVKRRAPQPPGFGDATAPIYANPRSTLYPNFNVQF